MEKNSSVNPARRRPIGVIVFVCLIMLFAVLSIKNNLNLLQRGVVGIMLAFQIAISLIDIVLAIYILRLNDLARKVLIFMAVSVLVLNLWGYRNVIITIDKQGEDIETAWKQEGQQAYQRIEAEIAQAPPERQESLRKIYEYFKPKAFIKLMMTIFTGFSIFWRALLIFYFTRPKVKAQFSPERAKRVEGE